MNNQQHRPKVFAVSGIKNSGKTTLVERLVTALKAEGYRVGVIKHDGHDFEADHKGTDSYRHKAAGAENVIVYSKSKIMMIKDYHEQSLEDLIDLQNEMDIVILEGMKYSDYPKLEIVRGAVSTESVCKKETLLALVTDTPLRIPGVPYIELNDFPNILNQVRIFLEA